MDQSSKAGRCLLLTFVIGALSGCNAIEKSVPQAGKAHINDTTKFSTAAYGVAASPRMTTSRKVRKGGGRRQIGRPYKIKGKWYTPKEETGYDREGQASWYGPNFHGRLTANGEIYDQYALSGAHPTFPLPSYARVTNLANGKSVIVRVNDRGPYHAGRVIDLSARASELLEYQRKGVAKVRVQYVGQAPLHGRDAAYLSASYRPGNVQAPVETALASIAPDQIARDRALADIPKKPPLDPISTGSVNTRAQDPFVSELRAIGRRENTGTTLSLRLKPEDVIGNNLK